MYDRYSFFHNSGWFDFFESLRICLESFPEKQMFEKRVQKTLRKAVLPFAISLFHTIANEDGYHNAVESGMSFLTVFLTHVLITDADGLLLRLLFLLQTIFIFFL